MDRMASIELAMKNEKTEMEFYTREASRSRNALAKAMFETLAHDELEHMTRITGLHAKLTQTGSWPETVKLEVAGTNIATVIDKTLDHVGSATEHDDDDVAAIKRAITFETNGERFYAELTRVCENPQEKEFFSFLSGIEREHKLSLTDTLAYLVDPEAWLEQHERSGLDGA
jgi:rubrerythrin